VTAKQRGVEKYIVTLSPDERASLSALIQKGRGPVRQLLKARILLKADASGADAAWSDGQIAAALETSTDTISRTRQRLVHSKPCPTCPWCHRAQQVFRSQPDVNRPSRLLL
jgi:hypothetical protein